MSPTSQLPSFYLSNRSCNCDLADAEYRKDAGVIDTKAALPVTMFQLGAVTDMSEAKLTVGDLYCAQEPLSEFSFFDIVTSVAMFG